MLIVRPGGYPDTPYSSLTSLNLTTTKCLSLRSNSEVIICLQLTCGIPRHDHNKNDQERYIFSIKIGLNYPNISQTGKLQNF